MKRKIEKEKRKIENWQPKLYWLYSRARTKLKRGIRVAKDGYKRKIEGHLMDNNPQQVWQGIHQHPHHQGRCLAGRGT